MQGTAFYGGYFELTFQWREHFLVYSFKHEPKHYLLVHSLPKKEPGRDSSYCNHVIQNSEPRFVRVQENILGAVPFEMTGREAVGQIWIYPPFFKRN